MDESLPTAAADAAAFTAAQRDTVEVEEALRDRAAVIAGFAALIAGEAAEVEPQVAEEHLARLRANVDQMQALLTDLTLSTPPRRQPSRPTDRGGPVAPSLSESILIVEADDDHFEMVRSLLLRPSSAIAWRIQRATSLQQARRALAEQHPTCSLVNLALPDADPDAVVPALRGLAPDHPIVVVTGYPENGAGVTAVRGGAQDYLIKGSMSAELLERSLRYATERSRTQAALAHQALHDGLTGLPNRALLTERLNLALARLDRGGGVAAVMFVDLDRFKLVNDAMGHRVGDQLLVAVADRLRAAVRRADLVARFGGDEFVVLLEDLRSEAEIPGLVEQVLAVFAHAFPCESGDHWLAASIGVAVMDDPDMTADALLANADIAMYRAKEAGRGRWALFDEPMHGALLRSIETEQDLASAVDAGQLVLHYQPVYHGQRGRIIGAEALLRWEHPRRGTLLPEDFLAVAEDSGLIVSIGAWVITQACLHTRGWLDQALVGHDWTTWVNVSTRQMDRPGLAEAVIAALSLAQLPAGRLGLEITESAFIRDDEVGTQLARRLNDIGVHLAVDDFGTGYSSMRRLRELPLDHLKIDGSFVAGVAHHPADRAIVSACVSLAHAMGMVPVAEGVETPEQLAALDAMGCYLTQGFWQGRPQPALEFRALLRRQALVAPQQVARR